MQGINKSLVTLIVTIALSIVVVGCGSSTPNSSSTTKSTSTPINTSAIAPTTTPTYGQGMTMKQGTYGTMFNVGTVPPINGAMPITNATGVQLTPLSSKLYTTMPGGSGLCPAKSDKGTAWLAIKMRINGRGAIDGNNFRESDQQLTQLNTVLIDVGDEGSSGLTSAYLTVGKDYTDNLVIEVKDASTSIALSYIVSDMPVAVWNLSLPKTIEKVAIPSGC